MSWLIDWIVTIALGVALYLLAVNTLHAEEMYRPLTLADCPKGYVLAVQDTDQPQPLARLPNPNNDDNYPTDQELQAAAAQQAIAPRQFVTGCVPWQPQQMTGGSNDQR